MEWTGDYTHRWRTLGSFQDNPMGFTGPESCSAWVG